MGLTFSKGEEMIEKDYDELQNSIRKLCDEYMAMFNKLDDILSRPDKEFDVTFNGHEFKFFPSTTEEEAFELRVYRKMLIHKILQHCSENFILTLRKPDSSDIDLDSWGIVLAFAGGVDPEDFKLEKIERDRLLIPDGGVGFIANAIGSLGVETIPLDQDSAHIKHQNPGLYEHALDEELHAE